MDELTAKVVEIKGCPIHYWIGGKAGKPWLVFLHGACVDHHSLDPIVEGLAGEYRVFTWDARGHGLSQPMGEPFTVPLAVEDVLDIMKLEGIETPVMIGHSNGTYIAQELAFRYPQSLTALVILDGTCITWPHSKWDEFLVKAGVASFDLFPYETLKNSSVKFTSDIPENQAYTYQAFSQLSKRDFIAIMKGVSLCLHPEPGYRVPVPLMIMHGDHDRTGDIAKISPLWAKREPALMYRVIPEASHLATLDNPEFILRSLREFFTLISLSSNQGDNQ